MGKKGRGLRYVTYFFKFLDPLHISGMDAARDFKFGVRIRRLAYKPKNAKLGKKGRGLHHVTYFFKFWDPLHISGMGAARYFKFGVRIHRLAYKPKNAKVGQKGRGLRQVTYFYNFDIPSISLERVQVESSNLVCRLFARPTNQKMQK